MSADEFIWSQKYRPTSLDECILPADLMKKFKTIVKTGELPNMILSGVSGIGKTTVARALCEDLDIPVMEINGSLDRNIDTLRNDITGFASSASFDGKRKCVIIDEADHLNPTSTQPAFRHVIEEFSTNCSFIFTCNYPERIIDALFSRCDHVEFDEFGKMKTVFAKRLKKISEAEGGNLSDKEIIMLVKKNFPDFRKMINSAQSYATTGIEIVDDIRNFDDLLESMKSGDFAGIETWTVKNVNNANFGNVLNQMYEFLNGNVKAKSQAPLILLFADYQHKAMKCNNQVINTMALLVEVSNECEFT